MRTRRNINALLGLILVSTLAFYLFCGIFVVQPIGAVPEGVTIVYWRYQTKMPFISSADGLLSEHMGGVSLLGRGVLLGTLSPHLLENKIIGAPYSETLYLISTKGKSFSN